MDQDDQNHGLASEVWEHLVDDDAILFCTNYVILETVSLIQHRFGMHLVEAFVTRVQPLLHVEWVNDWLHQAAISALLAANRRRLSLVDCTSFVAMRRLGIDTAFAFDQHFVEQGFTMARPS